MTSRHKRFCISITINGKLLIAVDGAFGRPEDLDLALSLLHDQAGKKFGFPGPTERLIQALRDSKGNIHA